MEAQTADWGIWHGSRTKDRLDSIKKKKKKDPVKLRYYSSTGLKYFHLSGVKLSLHESPPYRPKLLWETYCKKRGGKWREALSGHVERK